VSFEHVLQADASNKVIDEGQRSQPLALQGEASLVRGRFLRAVHSVAKLSDRYSKVKLMPRRPEVIIKQAPRSHRAHPGDAQCDRLSVFRHAPGTHEGLRQAGLPLRPRSRCPPRPVL